MTRQTNSTRTVIQHKHVAVQAGVFGVHQNLVPLFVSVLQVMMCSPAREHLHAWRALLTTPTAAPLVAAWLALELVLFKLKLLLSWLRLLPGLWMLAWLLLPLLLVQFSQLATVMLCSCLAPHTDWGGRTLQLQVAIIICSCPLLRVCCSNSATAVFNFGSASSLSKHLTLNDNCSLSVNTASVPCSTSLLPLMMVNSPPRCCCSHLGAECDTTTWEQWRRAATTPGVTSALLLVWLLATTAHLAPGERARCALCVQKWWRTDECLLLLQSRMRTSH
jgi:hypothetical protein